MITDESFAKHVLEYCQKLSTERPILPSGFKIINPFCGDQKEEVWKTMKLFYEKYYNDKCVRKLILGSSPSRKSSAITGIPFEDMNYLQTETGINFDQSVKTRTSSDFLHEVIQMCGGRRKFYNNFYMNFVFPLGIIKINSKGHEINVNYYENKDVERILYSFIVWSIRNQIELGIDRSVCYCIGSGQNYKFLCKINKEFGFFEKIIPLEHPRFIMQYNLNRKEEFLKKYLKVLSCPNERNMESVSGNINPCFKW